MELQGKIIDFLGDSFTEGSGVGDLGNRYDNRLKHILGLAETHNYGIGGTRIAHQKKPSEMPRHDLCFCGRAYDLNPAADVIVVYGGVNDYLHGDADFGKMSDKTPETFCGAVEFLMNLLKEKYPAAKLVFLTPAHLCHKGSSDAYPFPRAYEKKDAKPLAAYVNVIEEKANAHGIPVLNLMKRLPVDPNREEDRERYTADGLHLNDEGHGLLANLLAEFLRAL